MRAKIKITKGAMGGARLCGSRIAKEDIGRKVGLMRKTNAAWRKPEKAGEDLELADSSGSSM
ncbi:hypothetical protein CVT26_016212 [Gymnopilus dilepis]|uniref:Uncharacterized protein n=1 Tax=Gymnopilus dilepis TaxID=231916 RepID=A0A409XYZ1_9AGAR|nr:hypothetical protein CVT26_016212 [Gymnopilus dilepis]